MQVNTEQIKETIKKVLMENPEILISVLKENQEILRKVISDSLPTNIATKDDIKILHEELKLIIEMINKRFEDMNRRFEDMNKRFEDMKSYTDKRFEDMNKRMEFIQRLILFLLGLNLVNTSSLIVILLKIFNAI